MKKVYCALFVAVILVAACQNKPKVMPVDLTASKTAVAAVLEKYHSAMMAKDVTSMMALLTENGVFCGTDAKEILNKADLTEMMNQANTDTTFAPKYSIDKQEIRVADDGNSAIAMEQMIFDEFSSKMPVRLVSHLLKTNDVWLIDFFSWSFIPNNEDIPKLNKALE